MSSYVWGDQETQFFYQLDPETILSSVDSLGFRTTGRSFPLNSMENRVYEIEIESDSTKPTDHFVIAKFYRPGRWTKEQILEEHSFLLELKEAEIPVIAPIVVDGQSLFEVPGHRLHFCLFPKQGGRAPHDMDEEMLQIFGRLLARIHNVGASKTAQHRLHMTPDTFGRKNLQYLLESKAIPAQHAPLYRDVVEKICDASDPLFQNINMHRIHGDCHWGNVIYRENQGLYFIDFDDMVTGPSVQDVWLLIPGDDMHAKQDREILLESYQTMRAFDRNELKLIEPLRSLRYIHFAAWISKRWEDDAFKKAFPFYGNEQYWTDQIRDLTTQLEKITSSSNVSFPEPFDRWS